MNEVKYSIDAIHDFMEGQNGVLYYANAAQDKITCAQCNIAIFLESPKIDVHFLCAPLFEHYNEHHPEFVVMMALKAANG